MTPEKIVRFVDELNQFVHGSILLKTLIDPEDWMEIANVHNPESDKRYESTGRKKSSFISHDPDVLLAIKMCWDLLIPSMNPGATCVDVQYRSEMPPLLPGEDSIVKTTMWIGRDGTDNRDTAAATVMMQVRIPFAKDNEDLLIIVTPTTIRPVRINYPELSHARKVGMIRNAAEILINQEEFQSQDDRNKVIKASLNERFKNIEALDPNEIVVDDPGPRNLQGYSTLGSMISSWENPSQQSYVILTFSFQFIQATLWELRLPPWFIVTKNVHYPDPNQPAAAA